MLQPRLLSRDIGCGRSVSDRRVSAYSIVIGNPLSHNELQFVQRLRAQQK